MALITYPLNSVSVQQYTPYLKAPICKKSCFGSHSQTCHILRCHFDALGFKNNIYLSLVVMITYNAALTYTH